MSPAGAAAGEVLILDSTVSGGAWSTLAQKFVEAGKTPVIVDDATWAGMTAAEFDAYDAIVLGDPTCSGTSPAVAEANAAVWSSVVDGNVIAIGTDETYHELSGGAQLMASAAAFSVAHTGKTGAYISLSCYHDSVPPNTPVPLLSGFGTFTTTGVGCSNDAHIVATHPALTGLTDADLSEWYCSVHEGFDSFPVSFEVLAIAEGIGSSYTAPDGSVGTPYILARGVTVVSDIALAPATEAKTVGQTHTVTATATSDDPAPGTPVVGTTVTFTVIAGPNSGATGTDTTNASGVASFSYTGATVGEDTIEATFVDGLGRTQRSNRVTATWSVAAAYYADNDSDTYGGGDPVWATSAPEGHVADSSDCDDSESTVNPGATEIYNQVDDNCDGSTDEGFSAFYADNDTDTYGAGEAVYATSAPNGHVTNSNDCDDTESSVNPGATETYNQVDDNCDGATDEGFARPSAPTIGAATSGPAGNPLTARVRWTAPTNDGGSPITKYVVRVRKLNSAGEVVALRRAVVAASARSVVLELEAGRYKFTVRAFNVVGKGPTSASSNIVEAR